MTAGAKDASAADVQAQAITLPADWLRLVEALSELAVEEGLINELLERALSLIAALSLFGPEFRAVILLLPEDPEDMKQKLALVASLGLDSNQREQCASISVGECGCGIAIRDIRPLLQESGCDRCTRCGNGLMQYCIPLLHRGHEVLGVMMLYVPAGFDQSEEGDNALLACGRILANMISRQRFEAQSQKAQAQIRHLTGHLMNLQENEYKRLARELHDELGQALTAINADASIIKKRSEGDDVKVIRQSAESIISAVDYIYDIVHAIIRRLRPRALDDLGLVSALEHLLKEWRSHRPGLPCTFDVIGELDDLGDDHNVALYRMAQECMTNVVRHAAASQVDIRLERKTVGAHECVELEVCDDGRGMRKQSAHQSNSFGLLGIRERVEGLGGVLKVDSTAGKGACILARLPLDVD